MLKAEPAADNGQGIKDHEPATHVRWHVMAMLCALSFLTYYDRVCMARAQEDIGNELALTGTQMGLVMGAFWLAYGLFEIPGGWMGDRWGARGTLTRIVLAWSLLTALTGTSVGFWSLITYRFLFGVGEAGAYPNMARVQSRWLPVHVRARAGGLLWLVARWGGAFSPLLFGALMRAFDTERFRTWVASVPVIDQFAEVSSWRWAFWASGFIGIFWVVWFYRRFRDDPAADPTVNSAELAYINTDRPVAETGGGHGMPAPVWGALFTCPSLWAIGLLYIFGSFGFSFFVSWMPQYLKEVHKLGYADSESPFAHPLFYGGIACLVGGLITDWLVRATGRKRLARAIMPMLGYSTAATAIFLATQVSDPQMAIVLICVAGAGNDFGQGSNWATIVDIGGRYAGTTAGFINMVGNLGNAVSPAVAGLLRDNGASWATVFTVYAGSFLCAGMLWFFINPNRRFYDHLEPKSEVASSK